MAVFTSNLIIHTHVDFEQSFVLANDDNSLLNLNGYTAVAKIKRHSGSSSSTNFTVSFPDVTGGKVKLALSAAQTSTIKPGRYFYDLVLTNSSGVKTRVVEGEVFVKTTVTR